jgi:arylsulfatase A-like enzyme
VHNIHVPRLPGPEFRGKSTMGVRGDSIAEMDWMLGQILEELRDLGIERRTIVIFSSDNGPIADDGYGDQAVELLGDHKPAGPLRGSKYSAFEGGTAVPTVVYWPGTVRPGTSAAVVSQVDLYASLAALIGASLAPDEAIDSRNLLDAWTNRSPAGRDVLFEETPWTFALRRGEWKYVGPVAANFRLPSWAQDKDFEPGVSSQPQLYNLISDPGERHDVAGDHPDIVKSLQSQLEAIVSRKARETSG